MAGATKQELVKFIKDEVAETEAALGFVLSTIESGPTQHSLVYQRKKAEYEGVLWALNAVLDLAEDRKPDEGDTNAVEA